MLKLKLAGMILLCGLFLTACRKNDATTTDAPVNNFTREVEKVNAWLEKQKETASAAGKERISALQQNLDFASLIQPGFGNDEYLYIIPIKAGFAEKNNAERNPLSHLVLFITKETQQVRKGNIVQFIPQARPEKEQVRQFFFDYYGFKDPPFTGSLAYLTVADEMVYEINYREGKLNYYKSISKKQGTGRNNTCYEIGWYYFWSDGSVTWEPIGQYCDGCEPVRTVQGRTYRVECGGGGGGSGPDDTKTKEVTWEVYSENMYAEPIRIFAQVQLWGVKVSGEPQGGHFYRTADHGCFTENFSTYNVHLIENYTQSWYGTQNAYQLFQGTIDYSPGTDDDRYVARTKTFMFGEVF